MNEIIEQVVELSENQDQQPSMVQNSHGNSAEVESDQNKNDNPSTNNNAGNEYRTLSGRVSRQTELYGQPVCHAKKGNKSTK